ncbi:MAG: FAD:protein FMN transferase [Kiritimatiellae bacterium]|nr:FAD:protein FMN transferase [Kiritimatiellia bacterium]
MKRSRALFLFVALAAVWLGVALPVRADAPATFEWNAMGTRVRLLVRGDDAKEAGAAMVAAASNTLEAVEAQTSAFRAEGPLARLRETAGSGEWIDVGEPFEAALDLALDTARASGDAFNPLVAPLLEAHGFARRPPGAPPPEDGAPPPETLLDLAAIERWPGACRLAVRGMALDFGGLAKGLGADHAAAAARAAAPHDILRAAGGTLVGRGTWTIGLRDPRGAPDAPPLRAFALSEGIACATSGNYERFVETSDGTLVGHLFDPRTAQPARSDVLQATAFAPTAAEADAWSTALFVLGPDAGREALAARPGLAAVWVLSTPGGGVRLVPGGTAPQSAGKNP